MLDDKEKAALKEVAFYSSKPLDWDTIEAKRKAQAKSEHIKSIHFECFYSPDDGEWVAKCKEYPYLSWLDSSPEKAIKHLTLLIEEEVE